MIDVPRAFYDQIVSQSVAELPNEACGLIAGKDGKPVKLFRMNNADASPVVYRLDAHEQLRVFNEMDEQGWDLYAIYHSHTHTDAYPSETDQRQAFYPEARYLILSLKDRNNPLLRGFRIVNHEVTEDEVRIE